MKAMIMMDLLSTNKTLGRYLALVALFALLPSLLILNVPWMTVYAGVLIAYAAVLGARRSSRSAPSLARRSACSCIWAPAPCGSCRHSPP